MASQRSKREEEKPGKRPTQVMRVRQGETDYYTTIAVGWEIEINGKPAVSWKFSNVPIGWDGSAVQMIAKEESE